MFGNIQSAMGGSSPNATGLNPSTASKPAGGLFGMFTGLPGNAQQGPVAATPAPMAPGNLGAALQGTRGGAPFNYSEQPTPQQVQQSLATQLRSLQMPQMSRNVGVSNAAIQQIMAQLHPQAQQALRAIPRDTMQQLHQAGLIHPGLMAHLHGMQP